uniref:Uncharacterized protein n=1 Tax=mine drainage metagenome TaxID=410659 RepID=E6QK11_9ZZZZ
MKPTKEQRGISNGVVDRVYHRGNRELGFQAALKVKYFGVKSVIGSRDQKLGETAADKQSIMYLSEGARPARRWPPSLPTAKAEDFSPQRAASLVIRILFSSGSLGSERKEPRIMDECKSGIVAFDFSLKNKYN